MKRLALLSVGFVSLLGISACSSSTSLTITSSVSATDSASATIDTGTTPGSTDETTSDTTGDTQSTDTSDSADSSIPDFSIPDISIPDISIPDITIPDLSIPGLSIPGLSIPDISIPDISIPDISIPDISIPDIGSGQSADCQAFTTVFGDAFTASKEGAAGLADALDTLDKTAPDDLKPDLDVLGKAFTKLQAIYAKYDYDYSKIITDPEALAVFSDSGFSESLGRLETYYGKKCTGGGS